MYAIRGCSRRAEKSQDDDEGGQIGVDRSRSRVGAEAGQGRSRARHDRIRAGIGQK